MTKGYSSSDFSAFRCFYKDGNLIVCTPPIVANLKRVLGEIRKGKPYDFIYLVPLERIVLLAPVEVELKYNKYNSWDFMANPKECGVMVYKGEDGEVKFK